MRDMESHDEHESLSEVKHGIMITITTAKKRGKGIDIPKHGIAKARHKDHWGHVRHLYEEELDKEENEWPDR